MSIRTFLLLALILVAAACDQNRIEDAEDIPTLASVEDLQTAIPLTQNAPPPPYNLPVTAFTQIDNRLNELAGWRYVVTLEFSGVVARTPREVSAIASAESWFNQLSRARRIVVNSSGDLFGESGGVDYEAVRLGDDSFLIRDNACVVNLAGETGDAQAAAELGAGLLIGGVSRAVPAGRQATLNGIPVYAYAFEPGDLDVPAVRLAEGGRQTIMSYELWIAPSANAVIRFYVNLDVENAILLDSQLPVTGQVIIRYDLYDVGTPYNISVPFGC